MLYVFLASVSFFTASVAFLVSSDANAWYAAYPASAVPPTMTSPVKSPSNAFDTAFATFHAWVMIVSFFVTAEFAAVAIVFFAVAAVSTSVEICFNLSISAESL